MDAKRYLITDDHDVIAVCELSRTSDAAIVFVPFVQGLPKHYGIRLTDLFHTEHAARTEAARRCLVESARLSTIASRHVELLHT